MSPRNGDAHGRERCPLPANAGRDTHINVPQPRLICKHQGAFADSAEGVSVPENLIDLKRKFSKNRVCYARFDAGAALRRMRAHYARIRHY